MDSQSSDVQSYTNDIEIQKKMEDEHLRLQRQVRMIQIDRLQRTMGVHPQFRREDNLLRTLKKDYINLKKDLKIASSGANKKKDNKLRTDLKGALLLRTKTEMECNGGVTLMEQLDELLHNNNQDMLRLRKLARASQGELHERRIQSENRLRSTENQLEAAKLRFNVVQCENRKIREEIEHMLKDRAIFNQAWTKMMNALSKGKKFLTDLFESSTLAYDQRDEWCTKLRSVQEKGKMDQILHVQEMRDLQKSFDHETKLFNFLAKKGVMRVNKKQEEREEKQKKEAEEAIKKEYDIHDKILDDIYDYTQEQNVKKIADDFERQEQDNFSMYKLLTDYCAENEVLSRDLASLKRDVVDRRDWNEQMEAQREDKLEKLKQKLEEQHRRTEELREKHEERVQLINDVMGKVEDIFKILDCSLEPFENLLGDKQPTIRTFNLTLLLITEKIKEYLHNLYYYERCVQKKSDKTSTSRLKKFTVHAEPPSILSAYPINMLVPADPCPSCVEARWLSRVSVSDTPEVPFDREMALTALSELASDPAYERSDRIHQLTDCRVPRSRLILARRYMQN